MKNQLNRGHTHNFEDAYRIVRDHSVIRLNSDITAITVIL
jgi:hypothetical protein